MISISSYQKGLKGKGFTGDINLGVIMGMDEITWGGTEARNQYVDEGRRCYQERLRRLDEVDEVGNEARKVVSERKD